MKDTEFIEQLNLYLDNEISAEDAARLEAEVQSNPARRRVYQDYCRMQKACKLLAEDFADGKAADATRKVVHFEQAKAEHARRTRLSYIGGGLAAAAACLTVFFVGHEQRSSAPTGGPANLAQTAPAAELPAVVASNAIMANEAPVPAGEAATRNMNPLSLRNRTQTVSLTLTTAQPDDPNFAWLQNVRLAPLQSPAPMEQLRLEVRPALRPDDRTFTSGNKLLFEDVSTTAFRFQK